MTDHPLADRINCRAAAIRRMGRLGVRGRIRGEMVDAAMDAVERQWLSAADGSGSYNRGGLKRLALNGARAKAGSLIGWFAFQIFKAFIVRIIVDWFMKRSRNHA